MKNLLKKILITFALILVSHLNAQTTGTVQIYGQSYSTVTIGGKEWLTNNLRVTNYNDGTPIQFQPINTSNNTPYLPLRFQHADTNNSNIVDRGLLYNWYVVNQPNFVPQGWRIPTVQEWILLVNNTLSYEVWNCNTNNDFNLTTTGRIAWNNNFNQVYQSYNLDKAYFWTKLQSNVNNGQSIIFQCPTGATSPTISSNLKYDALSIRLVRDANLSINSFDKSKISIYPNPAKDIVNIITELTINKLQIFDVTGKEVYLDNTDVLNISNLNIGVYFLKITTNSGTMMYKLIKS